MDSKIKEAWLKALRSGEYQQGRHRLRNEDDCFCALGVLCDILDPSGWLKSDGGAILFQDYSTMSLSLKMKDYIGLNGIQTDHIMSLNDIDGKSFEDIADYVEEQL